jgi:hypothetical protein
MRIAVRCERATCASKLVRDWIKAEFLCRCENVLDGCGLPDRVLVGAMRFENSADFNHSGARSQSMMPATREDQNCTVAPQKKSPRTTKRE